MESGDEAIVANVEGGTTSDGDGGKSSGMGGTTSGGSVDLIRVEAALLTIESRHMSQSRGFQSNISPVSSKPPTWLSKRFYRVYRPRNRRGRLKIKPRNVSPAQEVKTTYPGYGIAMRSMQSRRNRIGSLNNLAADLRMQGERQRGVEGYG